MLDPTMLMLHGLMDHPYILEMESKRLKSEAAEEKLQEIIKRCMETNTDLVKVLQAALDNIDIKRGV
jgi:hypothetical protein